MGPFRSQPRPGRCPTPGRPPISLQLFNWDDVTHLWGDTSSLPARILPPSYLNLVLPVKRPTSSCVFPSHKKTHNNLKFTCRCQRLKIPSCQQRGRSCPCTCGLCSGLETDAPAGCYTLLFSSSRQLFWSNGLRFLLTFK